MSSDLSGDMVESSVIEPGEPWARMVRKAQRICIVDLGGQQAVDFLCYNADDPSEHYNAPNTIKVNGSLSISRGTQILSSLARPIFRVVRDTCGRHDTLGGCCSRPSNTLLYGKPGVANCRDTLLAGLARFDLGARDMVPNINWFMNVSVTTDGHMSIDDGISKAGDFVELRAEMDALAVLSNCPQIFNPANGFEPTPIVVKVYESDALS